MLDEPDICAFMFHLLTCHFYSLENPRNESRQYQANEMLLIPKPAFTRVVKEIFADVTKSGDMAMHPCAVDALQEVAEDVIVRELLCKP